MRISRLLIAALVFMTLFADGALLAQPKEVTGTFTIDKNVVTMTNVYAFARRSGAGEDQGLKILITSAPVPPDVIRGYINNSWINAKALEGQIIAIEVLLRPENIDAGKTAAGLRNCCQSNFYAKGLITEDRSLSISGTTQVSAVKTPAGRVSGHLVLPTTKNAPNFGGGATIGYDLTFDTKVLTSKSIMGPFSH